MILLAYLLAYAVICSEIQKNTQQSSIKNKIKKPQNKRLYVVLRACAGAVRQIRTADLILTKDEVNPEI